LSPHLVASFVGSEIVELIQRSGPVGKLVLAVLLGFSFFSWAVIYAKSREFSRATDKSDAFLRAFRKVQGLGEVARNLESFRPSPLAVVFDFGNHELTRQVGNPDGRIHNLTAIQRMLQIASTEQLARLEKHLNWLATTGAVTPFIGLFGTVWGIIDAFHGLGESGAASLRAVAPGISEALITTAAGLFVAIPAVVAYNHFLNQVRVFGARMDNFALEFLNAAERHHGQ
jgi:biopolymer transport protein TolQ